MGRFVRYLGHPYRVLRRIKPVEGGRVQIQLVAKHDDKRAQLRHACVRRLRQASEQYFTSVQFFSHRLRQVMARPHATHGLLGSPALLPLWVDVVGFIFYAPCHAT